MEQKRINTSQPIVVRTRRPLNLLPLGLSSISQLLSRVIPTVLAAEEEASERSHTIAEGSLDLSALVGIIETESVERYAVDYSKSYVAVAMATCSLLGIVGYARALFKLSLGLKVCEESSFRTAPVRTVLGVSKLDNVSPEDVTTVHYFKRVSVPFEPHSSPRVVYKLVKEIQHTSVSSHYSAAHTNVHSRDGPVLTMLGESARESPHHDYGFPLLLCTAAATSCTILLVSSPWTWTRIVASFGLFTALAVSSVMWRFTYRKAQVSNTGPVDFRRDNVDDTYWDSLNFEKPVALLQTGEHQAIANLSTLEDWMEYVVRGASFFCALVICLGYVCQYLEVRYATSTESGIWLGVQGFLAVIRIVVWVWNPRIHSHVVHSNDEYDGPLLLPRRLELSELALREFPSVIHDLQSQHPSLHVDAHYHTFIPVDLETRLKSLELKDLLYTALNITRESVPDWIADPAINPNALIWHLPYRTITSLFLDRLSRHTQRELGIDAFMGPVQSYGFVLLDSYSGLILYPTRMLEVEPTTAYHHDDKHCARPRLVSKFVILSKHTTLWEAESTAPVNPHPSSWLRRKLGEDEPRITDTEVDRWRREFSIILDTLLHVFYPDMDSDSSRSPSIKTTDSKGRHPGGNDSVHSVTPSRSSNPVGITLSTIPSSRSSVQSLGRSRIVELDPNDPQAREAGASGPGDSTTSSESNPRAGDPQPAALESVTVNSD